MIDGAAMAKFHVMNSTIGRNHRSRADTDPGKAHVGNPAYRSTRFAPNSCSNSRGDFVSALIFGPTSSPHDENGFRRGAFSSAIASRRAFAHSGRDSSEILVGISGSLATLLADGGLPFGPHRICRIIFGGEPDQALPGLIITFIIGFDLAAILLVFAALSGATKIV